MSQKYACTHACMPNKTRRLLSGGLSLPLRWDVLAVHPVRQPALADRLGLWLKKVTAWGPNASDRLGLEHKASNRLDLEHKSVRQVRPGAQRRPTGSNWSTIEACGSRLCYSRRKERTTSRRHDVSVPRGRNVCKEQSPKHDGIKMPPKRRAT